MAKKDIEITLEKKKQEEVKEILASIKKVNHIAPLLFVVIQLQKHNRFFSVYFCEAEFFPFSSCS